MMVMRTVKTGGYADSMGSPPPTRKHSPNRAAAEAKKWVASRPSPHTSPQHFLLTLQLSSVAASLFVSKPGKPCSVWTCSMREEDP